MTDFARINNILSVSEDGVSRQIHALYKDGQKIYGEPVRLPELLDWDQMSEDGVFVADEIRYLFPDSVHSDESFHAAASFRKASITCKRFFNVINGASWYLGGEFVKASDDDVDVSKILAYSFLNRDTESAFRSEVYGSVYNPNFKDYIDLETMASCRKYDNKFEWYLPTGYNWLTPSEFDPVLARTNPWINGCGCETEGIVARYSFSVDGDGVIRIFNSIGGGLTRLIEDESTGAYTDADTRLLVGIDVFDYTGNGGETKKGIVYLMPDKFNYSPSKHAMWFTGEFRYAGELNVEEYDSFSRSGSTVASTSGTYLSGDGWHELKLTRAKDLDDGYERFGGIDPMSISIFVNSYTGQVAREILIASKIGGVSVTWSTPGYTRFATEDWKQTIVQLPNKKGETLWYVLLANIKTGESYIMLMPVQNSFDGKNKITWAQSTASTRTGAKGWFVGSVVISGTTRYCYINPYMDTLGPDPSDGIEDNVYTNFDGEWLSRGNYWYKLKRMSEGDFTFRLPCITASVFDTILANGYMVDIDSFDDPQLDFTVASSSTVVRFISAWFGYELGVNTYQYWEVATLKGTAPTWSYVTDTESAYYMYKQSSELSGVTFTYEDDDGEENTYTGDVYVYLYRSSGSLRLAVTDTKGKEICELGS